MPSPQPIVTYDYDFSPYGAKIRMMLDLAGIPHKRVDVPIVLPRPQLESLDITYRRIPVVAFGKDVYCDTTIIMAKVMELQGPDGKLHKHPADAAFEAWGNHAFHNVLTLIPSQLLQPGFVKDRETIFPIINRPDFAQLRPSSLGAFASLMSTVENDFLSSGYSYIGGRKEPSSADVHVAWILRWAISRLGIENEPGFGEGEFPRTYAWIKSLPQPQPEALEPDTAKAEILGSDYTATSLPNPADDALHDLISKQVSVESADAVPGKHPQSGKLISASMHEITVELPNSIRLHFPRVGYYVKSQ